MNKETTDLQELQIDLIVEEELQSHLMTEYRFARYQTPRLHIGLVRFHQKMDMRMFQFRGAVPELMEGNFQA